MLSISKNEASQLIQKAKSAQASVRRVREELTEKVEAVVSGAEVAATAWGLGVINGRYGGVEVVGVPLDLLVGAAGHVLGLCGVAPSHMHAIGNGGVASLTHTLGLGVGRDMKNKAIAASTDVNMSGGPARAPGAVASGNGGGVSSDRLRAIALG